MVALAAGTADANRVLAELAREATVVEGLSDAALDETLITGLLMTDTVLVADP